MVNGAKVANGSLTGADIAFNSIGGGKINNGSLTGADINEATLGAVPNASRVAGSGVRQFGATLRGPTQFAVLGGLRLRADCVTEVDDADLLVEAETATSNAFLASNSSPNRTRGTVQNTDFDTDERELIYENQNDLSIGHFVYRNAAGRVVTGTITGTNVGRDLCRFYGVAIGG